MKKGERNHFCSNVARHIVIEGHLMNKDNIELMKEIRDPKKLAVAESIEIYKDSSSNLLNADQGSGYSWLFKHIRN